MFDRFPADFLTSEPAIRLLALFGTLVVLVGWEALAPRRRRSQRRGRRWLANLGLAAIDTAMLRLAAPAAAVGLAAMAQAQGWGLFHQAAIPGWLAIGLSLVLLDLALYGQHLASHAVPLLWRLHRVHHTDLDIDVTTGLRFHPAEILLSMLYKGLVVVTLGAPPVAVLIYEILLSSSSLFSHSNLRLPDGLERAVRRLWVTPDMHRVHHSVLRAETDSNYGTCLSLWDRLFRTYRAQPRAGHDGMTLGIAGFGEATDQGLWPLLTQPLRSEQPASPREAAPTRLDSP